MIKALFSILLMFAVISCTNPTKKVEVIDLPTTSSPPDWAKNTSIYEVNIRQYTPEGTINAFSEHLDSVKTLGTDIIWLMPIFPIGAKNHKGELGSAYSVKDYRAVNPDLGTMADLQALVTKAHSMDMHVILDWVANHTSWDNKLTKSHRNWYHLDDKGNFTPPVADWSDVIHLNYEKKGLRKYMIESMKFWLDSADVDGFRCDVAKMVPTDFWEEARKELDKVKPVFMLAEAEQADHLDYAFDMNYGWELYHIINEIAQGKKDVTHLTEYLKKYKTTYGPNAYRMNFITNHDENSWNGTINERLGDAEYAMAGLIATLPGMTLIYSGQEVGLDKRLSFFDKDSIEWNENKFRPFYRTLLQHKKHNHALWNGEAGGEMKTVTTTAPTKIFAFTREKDDDKVLAIFNFSSEPTSFEFTDKVNTDGLEDLFNHGAKDKLSNSPMVMTSWDYIILTNKR